MPVFRTLTSWSLGHESLVGQEHHRARHDVGRGSAQAFEAILERRPSLYSVTYGGIDAFNVLMTTKKAGLSLAEVYRPQEEIHLQVVDTIVRTPDAQLATETRYRRRLRLDTYDHYPKHAEAIRRWRAQRSK